MAEVLQFPLPLTGRTAAFPAESSPRETITLADPEARHAALDIHRSWIVEAPAGSGKTGLLIQRLLSLLAFGDIGRPSEVLAITFTRKAAAELRNRVLGQLSAAARGISLGTQAGAYERSTRALAEQVLTRDRQRGWRLLESPSSLNVRTIDSFCSELAASLPLLSGGSGSRKPVEDATPLYEQAAERALRELGGPDPILSEAIRCLLLHRDGSLENATSLLAEMLSQREQWAGLVPLSASALTEGELDGQLKQSLEATLGRIICEGLSRAQHRLGPEMLRELAGFAHRMSQEPGYRGEISPLLLCSERPQAPEASAEQLDHWLALLHLLLTADGQWRNKGFNRNHLGFEIPKRDKPWLIDLIDELRSMDQRDPGLREALCEVRRLPLARYPDDQWRVTKALFHVLRRALAELNALFAERSVSDFTETALTARRLLRHEFDLFALPGSQLTHLLVDEMQDTSSGQYELLELLTRHWDGVTQTLFLVGDPKQSIYAFRQARVERFLRTQSAGRLGDVPLGALRLTANFRSQGDLVQAFNATFSRIMPSPAELAHAHGDSGEVPFVAATAVRAGEPGAAIAWHTHLSREEAGESSTVAEPTQSPQVAAEAEDARQMRTVIESFLGRWPGSLTDPATKPRIAVLARGRSHFLPVIAEFRTDRGAGALAFRAVEIEPLSERQEILDLLALTRALLHPGDRVAWLAVLRSPVCGLQLADLLALTGEGEDADTQATVLHLVETRSQRLSPAGQTLLARTFPTLCTAQRSLGQTRLSTQVERTWRTLGADVLLTPAERLHAQRFLGLLSELEVQEGSLDLEALERKLSKLYAQPDAADANVELLTIHKAKGLEWDLVLVPSLDRKAGSDRHELLKWLEIEGKTGENPEVLLAPIQSRGDDPSSLSRWLTHLQKRREAAEAKRLFYVACTRAREELHLFATCRVKRNGELAAPEPTTLLGACWPAAAPVFEQQLGRLNAVTEIVFEVPTATFFPEAPLALAASGEAEDAEHAPSPPPALHRLPNSFDPMARFQVPTLAGVAYPPPHALPNAAPFARPEGSFAARAFGNAVHQLLEYVSNRFSTGASAKELLAELPGWHARLAAILRAEGLNLAISSREAERAVEALRLTLTDAVGCWLLAPHLGARTEYALRNLKGSAPNASPTSLRADRLFLAGPEPLSKGKTHVWIVDFKTADRGGRASGEFLAAEKRKYEAQLRAYAEAAAAMQVEKPAIVLALFYPLLPQMLHWTY